ncbi:MAG: lytic transglycosylase domain-containing protein, partial [Gammaproteobacteria bacterium]|nr:lytic transglycosylase domain-containing protein [Gammaproteobacteria bacterium]
VVALAAVLCAPALAARIYVYEMPNGGRMITDQVRYDAGFRLLKTYREQSLTPSGPVRAAYRATRSDYDDLIRDMAASHRIDTALVKAIIHAESAFDRYAISEKGALGLMQLMPATADRYGVDSAFDPHQNVRGGIRYLKDLLQQFDGDTRLAVAGYNAGENAVARFGDVPPFPETRHYVEKVLALHAAYRALDCDPGSGISCGAPKHPPASPNRIWQALGLDQ